jgi:hypothetical protein
MWRRAERVGARYWHSGRSRLTIVEQPLPHTLVDGHMRVMVLWAIPLVVRNVQVHTVVPRLWYPVPIVLQRLRNVSSAQAAVPCAIRGPPRTHLQTSFLLCPVVHARGDHVPPRVDVGEVPSKSGAPSGQRELRASASACAQRYRRYPGSKVLSTTPAMTGPGSLEPRRLTMIGATGTRASYTLLASSRFHAWNVIWRQQHPIPKAMASMWMYGVPGPGLAGARAVSRTVGEVGRAGESRLTGMTVRHGCVCAFGLLGALVDEEGYTDVHEASSSLTDVGGECAVSACQRCSLSETASSILSRAAHSMRLNGIPPSRPMSSAGARFARPIHLTHLTLHCLD